MKPMVSMTWLAVLASCGPPMTEPLLELTLSPRVVSDATPVEVRVMGTAGDGTVGKGVVKITSARGSLVTPVEVTLDGFGTAKAELICDPTTEPECGMSVRVLGEWTSNGVATTAEARLNASGAGGGPGGGAGGGAGGGSGETWKAYVMGRLASVTAVAYGYRALGTTGSSLVGMIPGIGISNPPATINRFGELHYQQNGNVYLFAPEAISEASGTANDVEVPTACGAGQAWKPFHWPDTGALVTLCTDTTGTTRWDDPNLNGLNPLDLGSQGHVLLSGATATDWKIYKDGAKVADIVLSGVGSHGSDPTGFLFATAACQVMHASFTGELMRIGTLNQNIPMAIGGGSCCASGGTFAQDGSLYLRRVAPRLGLVRCKLDGTVGQVYIDAVQPELNGWDVMVP